MKDFIKRTSHWLVLLFLTDIVFLFVTWVIRQEAMPYMSVFLLLFTVFICAAGFFIEYRRLRRDEETLLRFLELPDDMAKNEFLLRFGDHGAAGILCTYIERQLAHINEKTVELESYREYIEAWVHETKTPLSLFTLVLNNHKEEMSPYVYARMDHIRHQLNEETARILYYARLQSEHADYKFTKFRLDECVMEVIADYEVLMEERKTVLQQDLKPLTVVSDRRVVSFMLSQILSNAVKYADGREGKISVSMQKECDKIYCRIYNNGEGVPPEDAPFLFDKGFTGNHPNRQKATGMGLYLVRKYAEKLCVEAALELQIPYESGFGIRLVFTL